MNIYTEIKQLVDQSNQDYLYQFIEYVKGRIPREQENALRVFVKEYTTVNRRKVQAQVVLSDEEEEDVMMFNEEEEEEGNEEERGREEEEEEEEDDNEDDSDVDVDMYVPEEELEDDALFYSNDPGTDI